MTDKLNGIRKFSTLSPSPPSTTITTTNNITTAWFAYDSLVPAPKLFLLVTFCKTSELQKITLLHAILLHY